VLTRSRKRRAFLIWKQRRKKNLVFGSHQQLGLVLFQFCVSSALVCPSCIDFRRQLAGIRTAAGTSAYTQVPVKGGGGTDAGHTAFLVCGFFLKARCHMSSWQKGVASWAPKS